jgi:hypothetical protein
MIRTITTLFALLVLLPLSACAHHLAPASAGGYSLQLEDQYGNQLNTYNHRGATYVLGNYNTRYNVRITNHTGARVEAVLTVDGRDAVTGDVGNYKTQRGYVIDPYGSIVIDGFRKSMSSVAAFRFTNPGDSYSSRRGTPQNVGVVGVAIFKERRVVRRPMPLRRHSHRGGAHFDRQMSDAAEVAPSPSARAKSSSSDHASGRAGMSAGGYVGRSAPSPKKNNLGTRYGETRHSPVVEVPFQRAHRSRPSHVLSAYYDDHGGLAARGIIVHGHASSNPQPFPNNRHFAPPPAP